MKTIASSIKFGQALQPLLLALFFILGFTQLEAKNNIAAISSDTLFHSFTGKILNEQSETLPYASVSIENIKISTVSNADGEFLLKVPVDFLNANIIVSFLGYDNLIVPINSLQNQGNKLYLTSAVLILKDLTVLSKNPQDIIQKMLDERYKNYSNKDIVMTSFYRETIKNRNRNVSLAEAIVEIYKRSYTSSLPDMASLYKSRKSTDYNRLDTLVFKLMGGPYNSIYLDVMRYPEYIFTEDAINSYKYQFLKTDILQGRQVYVIAFEPQAYMDIPLYYGKLYIDAESYALAKAAFDLDLTDNLAATNIFIKRKPFNARVETLKAQYLVDYLLDDNTWYYTYSRIELDFKVVWKKKLFNSYYRTSIEMAATDWSDKTNKKEFRSKGRITPAVILQNEASGFADPDFWGEHNIIEPDKTIENAIDKISKQLNKSK